VDARTLRAKFAAMTTDAIVVVTGLPRSGTSMLMRMLQAGGLSAMTDGVRTADEDNPHGYFEYERVKALADDASWLGEAGGRSVKIITALLEHLPGGHDYKVILVKRDVREVLASQRAMLERRGKTDTGGGDDRMAGLFEKHLSKIQGFVESNPDMSLHVVEHREALEAPLRVASSLNSFLGGKLDEEAMARAVDRALHRNRSRPTP
jgi:hypothetical protein